MNVRNSSDRPRPDERRGPVRTKITWRSPNGSHPAIARKHIEEDENPKDDPLIELEPVEDNRLRNTVTLLTSVTLVATLAACAAVVFAGGISVADQLIKTVAMPLVAALAGIVVCAFANTKRHH